MSTKVVQKTADILAPIVFFVSMSIFLIATSPCLQSISGDSVPLTGNPRIQSHIYNAAFQSLNVRIEDMRAEQGILAVTTSDELEVMSETELILSYIDEITSTRYPEVDAELVKAIVYRESRYDPTCINSRTGASGLMQISPKWHRARAEKLGVDNLMDPYGNILVGCDFLNELFAQYSTSYALDVYAGGYAYANQFKGKTSPVVKELNRIQTGLSNGSIIPGGE